jgi:ribosome assembly protein RRB1
MPPPHIASSSYGSQVEMEDEDGLEFEDPFGDEFDEQDQQIIAAAEQGEGSGEEDGVDGEGDQEVEGEQDGREEVRVWRPNVDELQEGETLDYDPSAYIMYHALRPEWPCLSFDFIRDNLGDGRVRVSKTVAAQ